MTFLAPGAGLLAAGLVVPALLLLYFLKLRRRPLRVSSTFLWVQAAKDLQVNVPFRWLRLSWLLVLQVLIALALCAAVARPALPGAGDGAGPGGRVLILVDRSASMSAMDGRGPSGEVIARLDEARQRALDLVDTFTQRTAQRSQIAIAVFAHDARALTPFTRDRATLRESLEHLSPTDQPGDLDAGVRLARALALDAGEDGGSDVLAVIIISDGGFAPGELPAGKGLAVRFERVGPPPPRTSSGEPGANAGYDNAGIVAASARRDYEDPATLRVFARVRSASAGVRPVTLRLALDGAVIEDRVVQVGGSPPPQDAGRGPRASSASDPNAPPRPGAPAPAMDDAGHDASVSFTITGRAGGLVTIAIQEPDVLASDNIAGVVVAAAEPARLLLVGPGAGGQGADAFLLSLLRTMEETTLRLVDAETYEQLAAGVDGAGGAERGSEAFPFDLVLFDRVAPARRPPCPSVSFGAGLPALGVSMQAGSAPGDAPADRFVSWKRDHPLLRYVNLDSVVVSPPLTMTFAPPPGGTPGAPARPAPEPIDLADGASGPLIALVDDAGTTRVLVAFALGRTNWPPTLSFPVFLMNAVDFLTLRGESGGGRAFTTAQGIVVDAAPGASEVALVPLSPPAGDAGDAGSAREPVARASVPERAGSGAGAGPGRTPVALGTIERAGLYEVTGAAPGFERVAVNLLDENESSLRVGEALDLPGGALPASSGSPAPREVWHWFVLGAVGLLSLEWLVYAWRMRA